MQACPEREKGSIFAMVRLKHIDLYKRGFPAAILLAACVMLFLGRGWQHLFFQGAFDTLLCDPHLLALLQAMEEWGPSFEASTPFCSDLVIKQLTRGTGLFFLLMVPMAFFSKKKAPQALLRGSSLLYVFLSLLFLKEASYRGAALIEHAAQVGTPFLLVLWIRGRRNNSVHLARILIALTFIGHGLFAVGFYSLPEHFVGMTVSGLGVEASVAKKVLIGAGTLDLLASLMLFSKAGRSSALIYMIAWGALTAIARTYSNFDVSLPCTSLSLWLPHTLYRTPHALIPLFLFVCHRENGKT